MAALTLEDLNTSSYELARGRRVSASHARRNRGWFIRRLLAAADLVGVVIAFAIAELISRPTGVQLGAELFVLTLPLWVVGAKLFGLYDRDEERPVHSTADELATIFHLVTTAVWLYASFAWVTGLATPNVPRLTVFWIVAIATIAVCRAGARGFARGHDWYRQNTVIVGAGDIGQLLARKLVQHPEYGLELVGFVDAEPKAGRHGFDELPVLGVPSMIADVVEQYDVDRVIVAYSRDRHEDTRRPDPRPPHASRPDRRGSPSLRRDDPAGVRAHDRGLPAVRVDARADSALVALPQAHRRRRSSPRSCSS